MYDVPLKKKNAMKYMWIKLFIINILVTKIMNMTM